MRFYVLHLVLETNPPYDGLENPKKPNENNLDFNNPKWCA